MQRRDILLIAQDHQIAAPLHAALEDAGYHVRAAASVMSGLTLAREALPSVVLVERELPDGSGRDVVTRLRGRSAVPILVLTARAVVEETVDLLTLGADDVLVKPVAVQEVVARIGVHVRRPHHLHDERLVHRGLVIWPQRHLVTVHGEVLALTETERVILVALLRRQDHILSRTDLAHAIWDGHEMPKHSNVLDVHLNNLRAKLTAVNLPGMIRTVRHVGYVIRRESEDHLG